MTPRQMLDELTTTTMGNLWDLICNIPGGTDDDRIGLATAVCAEILARSLEQPEAEWIAAITNTRLAKHKLRWRLVPLAS